MARVVRRKRNRFFAILSALALMAAILVAGGAAFTGPTGNDLRSNDNWCQDHQGENLQINPLLQQQQESHDCNDWRWCRDHDRDRINPLWERHRCRDRDRDTTTTTTTTTTAPPTTTTAPPQVNPLRLFFCVTDDGRVEPGRTGIFPRRCGHPLTDHHLAILATLVPG